MTMHTTSPAHATIGKPLGMAVVAVALATAFLAAAGCGFAPAVPMMEYGQGFHGPEQMPDGSAYRWMGPEAVVRLKNTEEDMLLTLRLGVPLADLPSPPAVTIELAGTVLEEISSPGGEIARTFEVPAAKQGSRDTAVLRIASTQSFVPIEKNPATPDTRRLSLIVYEVSWKPRTPK